MDFVGHLPKTARGNDFIPAVDDRLSKMAHFQPCRFNIDGPGVAALFAARVFPHHGLPRSRPVVTDRVTRFLNGFNAAICMLLGTV